MVHVSGAKLQKDSLTKVNSLLYKILGTTGSESDFHQLFTEIFSKKEQILIAKRIVILYLLIKGVNQSDIKEALKVSSATVTKYATFLKDRNTPLIMIMKHHLKQEKFMNVLEDIFYTMFLQPGIKRGHWAQYWHHEGVKAKRKTSGI